MQRKDLLKTRETLAGIGQYTCIDSYFEHTRMVRLVTADAVRVLAVTATEKTEVVNALLRDADEQLKMQKMAVKFAADIRAHYHITD